MVYTWIHEIITTLFIDPAVLPTDFQPLIYLIELWALFIALKWALLPVTLIMNWALILTREIKGNNEWRPEWTRKHKRSLRKFGNDDD